MMFCEATEAMKSSARMPDKSRIVAPGPTDCTVRTADGQIMHTPADWELLPPGDAGLTRRVKAAGPTWTWPKSPRANTGMVARPWRWG